MKFPFFCFLIFLFQYTQAQFPEYLQLELEIKNLELSDEQRFNKIMELALLYRPFPFSKEVEEKGMPASHLTFALEALNWAEKAGDTIRISQAKRFLIDYYSYGNHTLKFVEIANEMVNSDAFASLQDKHFVYLKLGEVYKEMGFIDRYIELAPIQFEVGRKLKLISSHVHEEYSHIALAYYKMGSYSEAITNFKLSKEILRKENRPFAEASITNNIGLSYAKAKQKDSAVFYYKEALKILENASAKKEGFGTNSYNIHFQNVIRANVAYLNIEKANYDFAIGAILKELASAIQVKESTTEIQAYNKLGRLFFLKEDYTTALSYLNSANERIKPNSDNVVRIENLEMISKVLLAQGKFEESEKLYQEKEKLQDSINSVKIKQTAGIAGVIYEVQKKDAEIKNQRSNIELLNSKSRIQLQWMIISVIGLLGLFGVILMSRSRNAARTQQQIQQKFSHELLNERELERNRLSKELHDSVGQQLTLIKKKAQKEGLNEMSNLTNNLLDEVRSISRNLYPSLLNQLGLTGAVEQLLLDIDKQTELFVSVDIENVDRFFDKDASLNIYRFVQEAVNNVVKHANAKTLIVSIEMQPNKIEILIKDNGIGFLQEDKKYVNSLGLKTMQERIHILNGQFNLESKLSLGTTIRAKIPLSHES